MAAVAPFSDEETAVLERVPFCVFFLVAGADGKVDQQELESFSNGLLEIATSAEIGGPDGAVGQILTRASRYFEALQVEVKAVVTSGGSRAALGRIEQGAAIVDARLPTADAVVFKRVVFQLGQMIAEASGGLLGVGKVSKAEKEALASLGGVLEGGR